MYIRWETRRKVGEGYKEYKKEGRLSIYQPQLWIRILKKEGYRGK